MGIILAIYAINRIKKSIHDNSDKEKWVDILYKDAEQAGFPITDFSFDKPFHITKTRFGDVGIAGNMINTKKIVVFVHGILASREFAGKISDYFNKLDYSVISYDNYGWGDSAKFGYTTMGDKESDLLKDVLDNIKDKFQPEKIIIYGESMGGGTVYNFINKYGNNQVDKHIIDAGYIDFIGNVLHTGLKIKGIGLLTYLAYPWLKFFMKLNNINYKKTISKKELTNMTNIFHLHGKTDNLVMYNHFKKYKDAVTHHVYNKNVRHVRGWFDSHEEHIQFLDKVMNVNK